MWLKLLPTGWAGRLALVCVMIGLAGCAAQRAGYAQESYLLNRDSGLLCIEGGQCQRLALIVPSYREHLIAAAYGLSQQYYSWDGPALADLMLNPPGDLYTVELVDTGLYRLPPLFAIHTVWDVLALEEYELYERGNDEELGVRLRLPPPARRW